MTKVRRICLALPEVNERPSHGAPTFFVRDKKTFVMFHDDHHGDGMLAIWCAAPDGAQEGMVRAEPERFFRPAGAHSSTDKVRAGNSLTTRQ